MLAIGAGLLAAATAAARGGDSAAAIRNGGTLRIASSPDGLDSLDPALSYSTLGWALLDATCAKLLTYRDRRAPEGYRIVPEVARGYPRVSSDGKTYTFTLRRDFRFNDKQPVRP